MFSTKVHHFALSVFAQAENGLFMEASICYVFAFTAALKRHDWVNQGAHITPSVYVNIVINQPRSDLVEMPIKTLTCNKYREKVLVLLFLDLCDRS